MKLRYSRAIDANEMMHDMCNIDVRKESVMHKRDIRSTKNCFSNLSDHSWTIVSKKKKINTLAQTLFGNASLLF